MPIRFIPPKSLPRRLLPLLVAGLCLPAFQSCMEVGPPVDMSTGTPGLKDTTYLETTPENRQSRVVLLEEFTGVRCVNCPRAHTTIASLQSLYPGRVAAVGIHTGFYSVPYAGQAEDLSLPEGNNIETLLGSAQGYPSGAVNRRLFPGESGIIISDQKWSNYVNGERDVAPPVNVGLERLWLSGGDSMRVDCRVRLNDSTTGPLYLTVYLVENNLVSFQLNPSPVGLDSFYVHKHVARKMLTPYNGVALQAPAFPVGRVFERSLLLGFGQGWRREECELIALVHRGGASGEVLQAARLPVN
jgi:hypothetical protein